MKDYAADIASQITWVYTYDLDSTADFYTNKLGFECLSDEGPARIYATAHGARIGICEAFADRVVEPKGGMISLVTDDVDGWYRHLVERGVEIDQAPHRLEQFGIYTFFVRDPNGYVLEFQQFDS